ncbi:hypothetical protein F5B22DRAFT_644623 [Xylaria bambusicola]|uniref:uncharacterized protein n=1 Tax=Xylaria bambusicola TaxID=326684 RepID=UPI00200890AD|nr:uncharacterized protein F5B22DRAFT_644623 [Xylaria bambusicola]KAI0520882.1 hypothetical protein F5B22DRAFT_644623 [Xylaria bambusicola]
MDPVSAIGLAASLLTFIDFSWNLLSGTREVYQSASGTTAENAHINTVLADLMEVCSGLHLDHKERQGSTHLQQLGFLGDNCIQLSQKLISLLEELRRKDGNALWQSFKARWKSLRREGEVESLVRQLGFYRSQIILRLNLILKDQQCALLSKIEELREEAVACRMETMGHFDNLREKLIHALEAVQSQRDDTTGAFSRPVDAITALTPRPVAQTFEPSEFDQLNPIRILLSQLQNHATEIQVQHRILRELVSPSVSSRENSIADAVDGTFDWVLQEKDGPPMTEPAVGYEKPGDHTRPLPHHFGLAPEDVVPGRPWRRDTRKDEANRSYVRALFKWWLVSGSYVFHLSGKAGSGKSTLMKYIWQHPLTRQRLQKWASPKTPIMAHFYFWAASEDDRLVSLHGFYRSILFEILRQCPDLISKVFPNQWRALGAAGNVSKNIWYAFFHESDIVDAFDLLMKCTMDETRQFCFFIDGLDEFRGDFLAHRQLTEKLISWTTNGCVKICSSSRPDPERLNILSRSSNIVVSLHELTRGDIYQFSRAMFEKDLNFDRVHGHYLELVQEIVDKADGVFLWAFLVVRLLLESVAFGDDIDILYAKLNSVPLELNDMYRTLLPRTNEVDRQRRNRMLLFALAVKESASVHAYAWLDRLRDPGFPYSLNIPSWSQAQIDSNAQKAAFLIQFLARGLLETIQTSSDYGLGYLPHGGRLATSFSKPYVGVRFLHRSAYDFLKEPCRKAELQESFRGPEVFEEDCFRLFVADILILHCSNSITSRSQYLREGLIHLLQGRCQYDYPLEILEPFFKSLESPAWYGCLYHKQSQSSYASRLRASVIHLATFCGQLRYVENKIGHINDINDHSCGSEEMSLLLSAVLGGNHLRKADLVSCLLQHGVSPMEEVRLFAETDSSFAPGGTFPVPFESRDLAPVWMPIALYLAHFVTSECCGKAKEEVLDTMEAFRQVFGALTFEVEDSCFISLAAYDKSQAHDGFLEAPLRWFLHPPPHGFNNAGSDTRLTHFYSKDEQKYARQASMRVIDGLSVRVSPVSRPQIWNHSKQKGNVFKVVALHWEGISVDYNFYQRVF